MSSQLKQVWIDRKIVLCRPPQVYAAATNVFFVRGGAVHITNCVMRATAAAGGATTLNTVWNGVNGDTAAAVDIGTGTLVGEVVTVPMNPAGVIPGSLGAIPMTDALFYPYGMVVGLGLAGIASLIVFTFGVSTWTGTITIIYRKLEPDSIVTLI